MGSIDLYHGTSFFFAKKLLLGCEDSPLKSSGVFACASDLYKLMITTAGSFYDTAKLYPEGSGVGTVAPVALKNVHEGYNASLMAYGDFYASLNRRIAGSYAANNPCGSELLRFLDATISALRRHRVTGLDEVLDRYPDLKGLLAASHHPVVLELRGIAIERLLREDGRPFTEDDLAIYQKLSGMGGVRVPGSVRVKGPIAPYVRSMFRIHIAERASQSRLIKDDDVRFEEFRLDA